ncbi:alpha/beta hydrolase family protein [Streptomyces sp. Ag109_G2-15]|uniref:alpha/beta hydrolase family protein n=1 Tax=Streptomyces sp. Ag109_G2-15 TaxID=1938850 RepID=UPI00211B81A9|nr:alpha/beta hydrolase family protein [Streptomyces sp. Ag109_G2-15]
MGTQTRPKAGCPPTHPHPNAHPKPHRTWRQALLTAATVAALTAAAHPHIPAPTPATLPTLTPATLQATYKANRENATHAAHMATTHGDNHRATADRTLATRNLLTFDGRGPGQATEVLGDPTHADHIAVLVPGSDTSLDTYARFHRTAVALYKAAHRTNPRTAVIAWLGYKTPATVSTTVTTTTRADQAAHQLRAFIRELRGITPTPTTHISLLCHSYGSVVCARSAPALPVDDIVLLGSPGTAADTVAALHTPARVWAARGSKDWVAHVPHIRAGLLLATVGFGTDPVSHAFGARVFDAADADHSGYFTPGSVSLANLARITLGETSEVTRG